MASTIQLQRSINLAQQFVRNAPLTFTSPTNNDPAFSNADWVRQFILSAPFAWRWNRTETQITCSPGTTDYKTALPTFGWIEKAVLVDTTSGNQTTELEIELDLAQETVVNLPTKISPQLDDGAGNITFRVFPAPDKPYTINIISQNAAPIFTAATQTWAPIPDYLSYLINTGMEAKTYEYIGDPRFGPTMQLFLQQVIAANGGLSETQVNIFLMDRLNTQRETQKIGDRR